jgi:hypothetical protein
MSEEEIIKMANQANIVNRNYVFFSRFCDGVSQEDLKTFAKLVAENEREKCAKIAEWHKQMAFDIRARGKE